MSSKDAVATPKEQTEQTPDVLQQKNAAELNDLTSHNVTGHNQELPEFTLRNLLGDLVFGVKTVLLDPDYKRIVGPVVVLAMSVASKLVISLVPYTEIDFVTYMQQIEVVNDGELDYSLIKGDTGPVVYPAGFISVYQWIYWLTDNGNLIEAAQTLFSFVLTGTTLLSVVVYCLVFDMPPWPLLLFLLSKRLVSIYVLRLFNDVFPTICMVGVTLLLQLASYAYTAVLPTTLMWLCVVAADLMSLAISVKMNALLYVPGFVCVCYFILGENLLKLIFVLAVIPAIQVVVGWRFLLPLYNDEEAQYLRQQYLTRAFDFSRTFLYKWTVNWRFVPEDIFLSRQFHKGLLAAHVVLLLVFAVFRFTKKHMVGKKFKALISDFFQVHRNTVSANNVFLSPLLGPKYVMLVLSISNLIGVLCARSLHYQFLSWYCWQFPALLWYANLNVVVAGLVWVVHEYAWNVYPSTNLSSGLLVGVLTLVLGRIFFNTALWNPTPVDEDKKNQ